MSSVPPQLYISRPGESDYVVACVTTSDYSNDFLIIAARLEVHTGLILSNTHRLDGRGLIADRVPLFVFSSLRCIEWLVFSSIWNLQSFLSCLLVTGFTN